MDDRHREDGHDNEDRRGAADVVARHRHDHGAKRLPFAARIGTGHARGRRGRHGVNGAI